MLHWRLSLHRITLQNSKEELDNFFIDKQVAQRTVEVKGFGLSSSSVLSSVKDTETKVEKVYYSRYFNMPRHKICGSRNYF